MESLGYRLRRNCMGGFGFQEIFVGLKSDSFRVTGGTRNWVKNEFQLPVVAVN